MMKLARFLVLSSLIITLGCTVIYFPNKELLYAEIGHPMSVKETTQVLLKIDGYDLFSVSNYQLKLVATHRHDKPYLYIRLRYDKNKNMFIEYAEVDLPNLEELQRWRSALDKNESVILYTKEDK